MLAYITGVASNTYLPRTLVWVDRDGREDPIDMPARSYTAPDISPDGTRVAVTIRDVANDDLWVVDLTRETERRLTRDPAVDEAALWTPDGAGIVFQSGRERGGIFYMRADGTGNVERVVDSANLLTPWTYAADGRLLFVVSGPGGA